MASLFDAPIPGQSLTDEPGNAPWEKPAQYDKPEDAARFYIESASDPDIMDDISVLFENGMTLNVFIKTMVQTGTMNGMHTVDVGLLIVPILKSYFKAAMKTYGIEAKEAAMSKEEMSTAKQKERVNTALKLALLDASSKKKTAANDPGVQLLEALKSAEQGTPMDEAAMPEQAAPDMEQQPAAPQGAGLMARGA
mgnify:CR=1|tara:strand:- start:5393 stop:5977 length:585 start_codon:yes stop_codon:yes gene_type:complete